ncbi:hypothetical protein BJ322DRAFT_1110770 [Thelephora terrestris]|uniref:Uncharacterized protein n=1 Tax=Thelephora terrestris TaxID=56493 RepID=A0A9P6HBZ2_9AGAM|nr:hypothetical protein BJ322DRAFT_1110770 [Thelephora terrestris]
MQSQCICWVSVPLPPVYAIASTLKDDIDAGVKDVVVTYDIGCQWGKNFSRRCMDTTSLPPLDIKSLDSFRVAVPKFHITGHGASCQAKFNLAYMDGVGLTHGEGVETIWSHSTSLAVWSRENGPAARHMILDDHWNGWNWRKVVGLCSQLKTMLKRALQGSEDQRKEADSMTATWAKFVPEWRKMLTAYKNDQSEPNPFEEPNPHNALEKLRVQLLNEESEQIRTYAAFPHETSPSEFLRLALDTEAAQTKLKVCGKNVNNEDSENSYLAQRRALSKNITKLRAPQRLYMPGSEPLIDAINPILLADRPEDVQLWLPSALPSTSRDSQCIDGLPKLEYRLRYAQALKALHEVRQSRRMIRVLSAKRQSHIANTQRTKSRGLNDKVQMKLKQAASTYRISRKAIEALAPNEEFGPWKKTILELRPADVRGPGREESETSESRFVQSWIWTAAPQHSASVDDPDLQATLRVEWCKLQERAKRYQEEMELVVEEMRRTWVTFEQNSLEWISRATSLPVGDSAIDATVGAGIKAYAHKRADIQRRMASIFVDDWYHLLETLPFEVQWLKQFPRPPENKRHRLVSNVQLYHSGLHTPELDPSEDEITCDVVESNPHSPTVASFEDDIFD